jgi:hypothetical protein
MTAPLSPQRWAIRIHQVLDVVFGADKFPIDVAAFARAYTAQICPDDPIVSVRGDDLPGFDGALFRAPKGRKGWGIIYNDRLSSKGRINFTLGHEFGHYLMHREAYPSGFQCGDGDFLPWGSAYRQIEHQANVFAASLLMPYDDFRKQIAANARVDLDMLSECAARYRVSLVAAILRWLSYTTKRAVLLVSRDGFIEWARSSDPALKTGAYFKTSGTPIEVPDRSLAAQQDLLLGGSGSVGHEGDVWFAEPVREMSVYAEQYEFGLSLLLLEDDVDPRTFGSETEDDTYDRFVPPQQRREW